MLRFVVLALLFSLGACRVVNVPEGRVPAEYLERVQAYMGSYEGKFERRAGTLNLKLDGDLVVAEFISPAHGDDILGRGCGSKIGLLKNVTVNQRQGRITDAAFALDPAGCRLNLQGRELNLSFRFNNGKVTGINVSAYKETRTRHDRICDVADPRGGIRCRTEISHDDIYLYGSFKR